LVPPYGGLGIGHWSLVISQDYMGKVWNDGVNDNMLSFTP